MKTRILFSVLLFFYFGYGFTQQIPQNPNKVSTNGLREGQWTVLFKENWKETQNLDSVKYYRILTYSKGNSVGVVRNCYRSGKIQWEGKFVSLNPDVYDDGLFTSYHENGNINEKVNIVNGTPNGEYRQYFSNGKISMSGFIKNWKKEGLWKEYDTTGGYFEYNYENGSLNGKSTSWYSDGKKKGEQLWVNDKMEGLCIEWFEDGNKSSEGVYKDGLKEGLWIDWTEKRNKLREIEYKNGLIDGYYKIYNDDGSYWLLNYVKGEEINPCSLWGSMGNKLGESSDCRVWSFYYENGKIKSTGIMENGQNLGFWKEYDEDGILSEGNYINGKKEGIWICWYSNGKKLSQREYKNGLIEGEWKVYNVDGTLYGTDIYKNGVLQKNNILTGGTNLYQDFQS